MTLAVKQCSVNSPDRNKIARRVFTNSTSRKSGAHRGGISNVFCILPRHGAQGGAAELRSISAGTIKSKYRRARTELALKADRYDASYCFIKTLQVSALESKTIAKKGAKSLSFKDRLEGGRRNHVQGILVPALHIFTLLLSLFRVLRGSCISDRIRSRRLGT